MPYVRTKNNTGSRKLRIAAVVALAVLVVGLVGWGYMAQQQRMADAAQEASEFNEQSPAPTLASATPPPSGAPSPTPPAPPTIETAFTDGIPSAVEGTPFRTTNNAATGAEYVVIDGQLTNTASGPQPAASYLEAVMPAPVKRVGATFVFREGATAERDNGAIMVGVWQDSIVDSFPTIPNSPAHFVITPTAWVYGVWASGTGNQVIASGKFSEPLTPGEEYTVDIQIDKDTATIALPDGETQIVTDPRIESRPGPFPCWEVFQNDASTESKASFVKVWAS